MFRFSCRNSIKIFYSSQADHTLHTCQISRNSGAKNFLKGRRYFSEKFNDDNPFSRRPQRINQPTFLSISPFSSMPYSMQRADLETQKRPFDNLPICQ